MIDSPIFKVKNNCRLGVITFDGIDESSLVSYFHNTFRTMKAPVEISIIKAQNENYKRGIDFIEKLIGKAKHEEKCTVCLILIPNQMSQNYRKIKEICLLEN